MTAGHRLRSLAGWLFPLLFALTGCFLTDLGPKPSSGSGVAVIDGTPVAVSLSAKGSFFVTSATTVNSAIVEEGTIQLEFRASAQVGDATAEAEAMLRISGHLAAVPAGEHVGAHTLPVTGSGSGFVDAWKIEIPEHATMLTGTLTLSGVTDKVISGTLHLELSVAASPGAAASLITYECAISVGRQYGGDGDFDD
ncbi:MAG TPA: hypothetical protein VGE07_07920 [Herpetosiphonaceae bacterium]